MGSPFLFHENLLQNFIEIETMPKKSDCSTDVWKDQPDVRGKNRFFIRDLLNSIYSQMTKWFSKPLLDIKESFLLHCL